MFKTSSRPGFEWSEFVPRWWCFAELEGGGEPEPSPEPSPEPDPSLEPDPALELDPAIDPAIEPEPKAVATSDWRDRRIAKLTAQLREAQAGKTPATTAAPAVGTPEFDTAVEVEAARRTTLAQFNSDCERVAAQGRKDFPDFESRVGALAQLVDQADPRSVAGYADFISAAIETGEGAKVIHGLGADLNEAERILALPPIKMAIELAKLAAKADAPDLSRVPKPPTPVGNRGASHTSIDPRDKDRADHLSTAEWMARREAQIAQSATRH